MLNMSNQKYNVNLNHSGQDYIPEEWLAGGLMRKHWESEKLLDLSHVAARVQNTTWGKHLKTFFFPFPFFDHQN